MMRILLNIGIAVTLWFLFPILELLELLLIMLIPVVFVATILDTVAALFGLSLGLTDGTNRITESLHQFVADVRERIQGKDDAQADPQHAN